MKTARNDLQLHDGPISRDIRSRGKNIHRLCARNFDRIHCERCDPQALNFRQAPGPAGGETGDQGCAGPHRRRELLIRSVDRDDDISAHAAVRINEACARVLAGNLGSDAKAPSRRAQRGPASEADEKPLLPRRGNERLALLSPGTAIHRVLLS